MSTLTALWPRYRTLRHRAFLWRRGAPVAVRLAMAFGMAALTGLLAQVQFRVQVTEVPFTGQVLGVLLAGVLLGRFYGGLSQAIYVVLGAAGLPWFAGVSGGLGVFVGPTGGYLVGFVIAALLIGFVNDRYIGVRGFGRQLVLMLVGVGAVYLCGALHYSLVMQAGPALTLLRAVAPFVPGDVVKALIAASVAVAVLPKTSFNGEVDARPRDARA